MGTRVSGTILLVFAAFLALTVGKAMAAPAIETEPAAMSFGKRAVDQIYNFKYLDVYSLAGDVEVTDANLTGTDAGDFFVEDLDCLSGTPATPDTPCSLLLNFLPQTAGVKSAGLVIETDSGDPLTVPLTGIGTAIPDNAPDLAAPSINAPIAETYDLWGYAGGDFEGEGRSGVVSLSLMEDWSLGASFAYGKADGLLTAPFGREVSSNGVPGDAATGDFDGDGDLDAAAGAMGGAKVFLNDGTGDMSTGAELPVDPVEGIDGRLAAGDFNGDGIDDLLGGYGTYDDDTDTSGYMLQLFLGNEEGTFEEPIAEATTIDTPMGLAAGNFDDDGNLDFAASGYDGFVYMFDGDGLGGFTEAGKFGPTCGCASPWGIATGDLDGNGLDDVVATLRFENELAVFLAQADGTFLRGERIPVPSGNGWDPNPYAISIGDLNGDAKADLLSGNYLNDTATVFVGAGDGTFVFAEDLVPIPEASFGAHGTYIGDFNGDGKSDPSVASQDGPVAIFLNEGEPGQVPVPSSLDFGDVESGTTSAPLTVEIKNEDGLAKLVIGQVEIGGGASSDFEILSRTCGPEPIPVGGSCEIEVVFDPNGPAEVLDSTLYVATNHSEDTQLQIPLSGTVTEPPPPAPGMTVDPAGHDYGSVQVGSTSAASAFTVTSSGEEPLVITQITIDGAGATQFKSAANGCVGTFAPGAKCAISLEFAPTSAGAKSATVRFASNVTDAGTIALSGTGTAVPPIVKPPKVLIKKRPKATIRIRTRVLKQTRVAFRANQGGSKFRCRVDRKKFRACKSPLILRKVKPGRHVVRIQAIKAGKRGPVKLVKFRVIRRR